jgi:hypothetical protein
MYSYVSYGLGIHSILQLPELTPADVKLRDVVINLGETGRPVPRTDHTGCYFDGQPNETFIFWDRVGGFLVRNGEEIIIEPLPGAEESLVRLPLLGAVLSVAIHQRGLVGLHASAVRVGDHAIAFLGPSGLGKSTMAAALYARGHAVLADDLVVLNAQDNSGVMLLPGFPQLKLFPEALSASLGENPNLYPTLLPGLDKRARMAQNGFSTRAVPITSLYVLSNDAEFSVEPIPTKEKIPHLIRWGYGARTFKHWLKGAAASAHLQKCAAIANRLDFQFLNRPRSFETLPDLARTIEELVERS